MTNSLTAFTSPDLSSSSGSACELNGRYSSRAPKGVRAAEEFTRTRLSKSFFMRDFLFSEIAAIEGLSNLPGDPKLAIAAGRGLCENLLEPLQATFGRLAIRSAYRSPEVNGFGCSHRLSCASNEKNRARHTWDRRDKNGHMGALTTVVVPWLVDRMAEGITWQAMAWWIHDNLPYSELQFFPKLLAFNIGWHEAPKRTIYSFIAPRGFLTKPGFPNHDGDHSHLYRGFPGPATQ
ncbi:MAG TPA: hypothetical protein VK148_20885 [Xanthobacteraceae bacterium]|nr:hypothetical protein [Xanthobacteraceae bacterium]